MISGQAAYQASNGNGYGGALTCPPTPVRRAPASRTTRPSAPTFLDGSDRGPAAGTKSGSTGAHNAGAAPAPINTNMAAPNSVSFVHVPSRAR